MNILFVAQRYYPFLGGVETQTRLVVHELAARHHVEVVAMNFGPSSLPDRLALLDDSLLAPSQESFDDGGIAVHSLAPSWTDRLRMLPIALRATPRLQRYAYHQLRNFGYRVYRAVYRSRLSEVLDGVDVVHSVAGGYLGWLAQEVAAEKRIPFVCTPYVHPGQHGDDEASAAYYRRSDAVFALLETDRQYLSGIGVQRERIHISGVVPLLPDSADPEGFRVKHGLQDKPVVLFVGRVVEYKGAFALLDAARAVWERHPDVHFLFVGPAADDARARLETGDPRMRYLGLVSDSEKADALAACDLFCMPSQFEILPAVYLEAWTYGKAVIGGKAAGLPDLIEGNDAGVTVERSPEAIALQIKKLLEDSSTRSRMGENGRALVGKRYTKEALVRTMEDVYLDLVESPAARKSTRPKAVGC